MSVTRHLGRALEIQIKEPDWRKWGPLIEALTPEEQAEVRPYLRMQARIAQGRTSTKASAPLSSRTSSFGRTGR